MISSRRSDQHRALTCAAFRIVLWPADSPAEQCRGLPNESEGLPARDGPRREVAAIRSDRLIRAATAGAVLLVAAIAAMVSYQHLYHLAVTHGETRLDADLLPLSIDGTVVTGSLLMLRSARQGIATPWLARIMLTAAVAMTIAANPVTRPSARRLPPPAPP